MENTPLWQRSQNFPGANFASNCLCSSKEMWLHAFQANFAFFQTSFYLKRGKKPKKKLEFNTSRMSFFISKCFLTLREYIVTLAVEGKRKQFNESIAHNRCYTTSEIWFFFSAKYSNKKVHDCLLQNQSINLSRPNPLIESFSFLDLYEKPRVDLRRFRASIYNSGLLRLVLVL